ncbi:glutathione S-transferase family protein [Microvirga terrae]|uniref:Glutathione S-transferase family protein n=1 Tax=Microvirga terrae TaxID=2740529 RepID=A0ABY5RYG3_9HYPH|nr:MULTISPECIES: glutathione S-transferase family protein [Microvirga]MBQ0823382.1 glutathione S-transferase family protein [Microvirga sp. HBU67558]UVF20994.1 glutathione S-transferase family protein [Microvirga terrae]
MPTLVIANKCYSSWSLRPWLLMKQLGVTFDEITIPLDLPDTKAQVLKHSPAGKVPILIDGDVTVWESIAIMEYVGDAFGAPVWPDDRKARAMARSIAAEMHAGFSALRSACPMNLGKKFARKDRSEAVARDVARFSEIVRQSRERFGAGGLFLFGAFSAADAMYAPLVTRLDTYSIALDATTQAYVDAILSLPAFQEWRAAAMTEEWVVTADEIDEEAIENYRRAA